MKSRFVKLGVLAAIMSSGVFVGCKSVSDYDKILKAQLPEKIKLPDKLSEDDQFRAELLTLSIEIDKLPEEIKELVQASKDEAETYQNFLSYAKGKYSGIKYHSRGIIPLRVGKGGLLKNSSLKVDKNLLKGYAKEFAEIAKKQEQMPVFKTPQGKSYKLKTPEDFYQAMIYHLKGLPEEVNYDFMSRIKLLESRMLHLTYSVSDISGWKVSYPCAVYPVTDQRRLNTSFKVESLNRWKTVAAEHSIDTKHRKIFKVIAFRLMPERVKLVNDPLKIPMLIEKIPQSVELKKAGDIDCVMEVVRMETEAIDQKVYSRVFKDLLKKNPGSQPDSNQQKFLTGVSENWPGIRSVQREAIDFVAGQSLNLEKMEDVEIDKDDFRSFAEEMAKEVGKYQNIRYQNHKSQLVRPKTKKEFVEFLKFRNRALNDDIKAGVKVNISLEDEQRLVAKGVNKVLRYWQMGLKPEPIMKSVKISETLKTDTLNRWYVIIAGEVNDKENAGQIMAVRFVLKK